MIIGMDEAGTGAWAGPISVGAVATPWAPGCFWQEVADSKVLLVDDREWLFSMFEQEGIGWAVGMSTHEEVDRLGLPRAKRQAAQRALYRLFEKHPQALKFSEIVIDGNNHWGLNGSNDPRNQPWLGKTRCLVKADATVPEVSAASICAKVLRDRWMRDIHDSFPEYGFKTHVGYGVPQHREALAEFGPSVIHRMSVRPVLAAAMAHAPAEETVDL